MAFCSNCGTQLNEGKKFCSSCGQPAAGVVSGQQQQQAPRYQQQTPRYQQQTPQQGLQHSVDRLKNLAQNTADETGSIDPADIEKNKAMGGLAYLLFFLPLIACPDSKYGRFHANQGLVYLLLCVAGGIVNSIQYTIFMMVSWRFLSLFSSLISFAIGIGILAIGVIGLLNGFSGKAKELPVIGKFRLIK